MLEIIKIQFTFKDILFAFERSIYDQFKSFTGFSQDVVCPVCQRTVPADDAEVHLLMCLTRPRVTYNGSRLCVIVFILKKIKKNEVISVKWSELPVSVFSHLNYL